MKTKHHLLAGLALLAPLALQSCLDSNYDLNDIDTTVRLKTTELTVPINLDVLTLDQVMEIEDDSEIVKDIDPETGKLVYAIKKDGTFDSDDITVAPFTVPSPNIEASEATLTLTTENLNQLPVPSGTVGCYIVLPEDLEFKPFSSKVTDVDKSIHAIKGLGVETTLTTTIKTIGLEKFTNNMRFVNLILKFPAGLRASYTKGNATYPIDANGYLDLSKTELSPTGNGELRIVLDIDSIDATTGNLTFDYGTHTLTFADEIQIVQGTIAIKDVTPSSLPTDIQFILQPALSDIHAHSFSGTFAYDVEDFTIDPIDLSSLPDFLNQTGTKIWLENPQIYLSITNPLNPYNVRFESGFQLTATKDGQENAYRPDNGQLIEITSTGKDATGNYLPNEIVMAPHKPSHYYEGYTNPDYIAFSGLKNLLAETGDGIPNFIKVDVLNPNMPMQEVNNFRLGETLDPVHGTYAFYAPLQLSEGSCIAYTDTIDGWNDEDVDALTFTKIVVEFDATTDLPYEVELSIAPITFDAVEITESSKVMLAANTTDQPVKLTIIGNVKHLDGLNIKAKVTSQRADAMSPDMKLYMKNSKITLTGYYEKEL